MFTTRDIGGEIWVLESEVDAEIERLQGEIRQLRSFLEPTKDAEIKRLRGIIGLFCEYRGLVHIGSAEAIGEAEDRLDEGLQSDPIEKCQECFFPMYLCTCVDDEGTE